MPASEMGRSHFFDAPPRAMWSKPYCKSYYDKCPRVHVSGAFICCYLDASCEGDVSRVYTWDSALREALEFNLCNKHMRDRYSFKQHKASITEQVPRFRQEYVPYGTIKVRVHGNNAIYPTANPRPARVRIKRR